MVISYANSARRPDKRKSLPANFAPMSLAIPPQGGYSLKCYTCTPDLTGSCVVKEETCPDGYSKCLSSTVEQSIGSSKVSITAKQCASQCEPGTVQLPTGGTMTVRCCDTDLCNAADDAEVRSKRRVFLTTTPFIPSKLSLRRVNPLKGLGHRDEPFRMGRSDVKCPQTGVSTEDGGPQQILGMVQCHGRDPPSLLLPSDSIKDTLKGSIIMVFLILWINDVPIEKSSSEGHDDEGVHQLLDQNKAAEWAQLCEMAAGL
ncbi:hypothetical protein DPX16_1178 [Anabarilius grahami]|uniref:UPAR/Ly6 domain-containing protein n=1 Tax=Anabarilius grahami TaxID=495550 RepID=A0A3N0XVE5_ANAGA|nr:hypothetical protein DPX16_1178 [Anabarilius grahami]